MFFKLIVLASLVISTSVFAGECTLTFAALGGYDAGFDSSFFDHHNKKTVEVQNASECVKQAKLDLGKKRRFKSDNRFAKRDELRTIAQIQYQFQDDDKMSNGKIKLDRMPSSFF